MAFVVRDRIDGREVVWELGSLTGEETAVAQIERLAEQLDVVSATATGPHYPASLEWEEPALLLIEQVFTEPVISGDAPVIDREPGCLDDLGVVEKVNLTHPLVRGAN